VTRVIEEVFFGEILLFMHASFRTRFCTEPMPWFEHGSVRESSIPLIVTVCLTVRSRAGGAFVTRGGHGFLCVLFPSTNHDMHAYMVGLSRLRIPHYTHTSHPHGERDRTRLVLCCLFFPPTHHSDGFPVFLFLPVLSMVATWRVRSFWY
jgi:hypothetical protein